MISPSNGFQEQRALRRAREALRCLPFRLALFRELDKGALSSTALSRREDWSCLCRRRLTDRRTEDHLIWLIQLGVLRREVDGQGLTERVRLTPLGRAALAVWDREIPRAGLLMRLRHWFKRHRPAL